MKVRLRRTRSFVTAPMVDVAARGGSAASQRIDRALRDDVISSLDLAASALPAEVYGPALAGDAR